MAFNWSSALSSRDPIPTWFFALVVVRKGDQYLLVHERKFEQTWFLPAGRVEPGETFAEAARRETLEETGVPITLTGVLRIEHSPAQSTSRMRIIYLAEPADDTKPKSVPDEESLGAEWVRRSELGRYPLRSEIVRELIEYLESGGTVYPLTLVGSEKNN